MQAERSVRRDLLSGSTSVFEDIGFAAYERRMDELEMRMDTARKTTHRVVEVFETISLRTKIRPNKPQVSVVTI